MPELPEVENVRIGLAPALTGARFSHVELRRSGLRYPFPPEFAERLTGRTVLSVDRRAKYLIVHLDGAEQLVVHLGMSGRLLLLPRCRGNAGRATNVAGTYVHELGRLAHHDHVVMETSRGDTLVYNDPRRFGFMTLVGEDDAPRHAMFAKLGVEPLGPDLTSSYVIKHAANRRLALKSFLMDQSIIAGLGNIYVCEALFRAGLSPMRQASTLAQPRQRKAAGRLVAEIRSVIEEAVASGGSTLRDYRKADGQPGDFAARHAVYDRQGQRCVRVGCGGSVLRVRQGERSTFYCPRCQH